MYRKLMLYTLTAAVTAAISVGVVSAQVLTIDELDELTNKNARRIQLKGYLRFADEGQFHYHTS